MARKPFRILAIAGSLRQGSYNRGLLRAAQEVAPDWVEVQFFDIGQLPFFNEDVEAAGDPEPVSRFKEAIAASNAVLIATPEYNGACRGCSPTRSTGHRDRQAAACYATNRWPSWVRCWANRARRMRRQPCEGCSVASGPSWSLTRRCWCRTLPDSSMST